MTTPGCMPPTHDACWSSNSGRAVATKSTGVRERAAILAKGDTIHLSALPERVTEPKSDPLVSDAAQTNPTLDTIERAYILWVLENEGGNKPRTAEVLGIDPSTLYRKLTRYGLPT